MPFPLFCFRPIEIVNYRPPAFKPLPGQIEILGEQSMLQKLFLTKRLLPDRCERDSTARTSANYGRCSDGGLQG